VSAAWIALACLNKGITLSNLFVFLQGKNEHIVGKVEKQFCRVLMIGFDGLFS